MAALLGVCLLCFFTQEINPFPHDGWFASQYRFLKQSPGAENFTPVAAPALVHGGIHVIGLLTGMGLQAEIVWGALAHQGMLAMGGAAIYLAHRRLGLARSGAAASLLTVLFVESIYLPHSFWSENSMLLLACLALWWGAEVSAGPSGARLWAATIGLGLAVGAGIVTRATPILLIPGVIWLAWPRLRKQDRRTFATTLVAITAAIVVGQMTLNHWRYSRFELSHSVGLRLWDAISPVSDEVLDHAPLYQEMKRMKPDLQGSWWWELPRTPATQPTFAELEDAVRPMVLEGIWRNPLPLLSQGARDFRQHWLEAPAQLGILRADYYNPLDRETMLPPPGAPAPTLTAFLDGYWRLAERAYGWILLAGLAGGLVWAGMRRLGRLPTSDQDDWRLRVWLWTGFTLLSVVYVSNQIEKGNSRFALPYLGYLALMGSVSLQFCIDLARRFGRAG